MAERVQIDVELAGADKAAKGLDDVADAAERVEDHDDVAVEVDADTTDAARGLRDVADEAEQLDGRDASITATLTNETSGPMADIFSDLDKLEARAKQAGERLDDVTGGGGDGARFTARGNAISDLTGPLGDVSSTASDVAGVFDGFSDILEGLAPKMGISADQMVGAIGGIGFAITAAATVWGYFSQKQEEAAAKQQQIIDNQKKINELVADQKFAQAGEQLVETYSDAYDAARKLGISAEDLTLFLTGQKDITEQLADAHQAYTGGLEKSSIEYTTQNDKVRALTESVTGAKVAYDNANDSLATQATRADQAAAALAGNKRDTDDVAAAQKRLDDQTRRTSEAFDRLRGAVNLDQELLRVQTSIDTAMSNAQQGVNLTADEVLDLKGDIINLAETAKAHPAEVKSTLDKIDRGDLAGVKADAEGYYARAPVQVTATLKVTDVIRNVAAGVFGGGGGPAGTAASRAPAVSSVVNVTQYLPRGWRGDALAAAGDAARRSGGLYRRNRR